MKNRAFKKRPFFHIEVFIKKGNPWIIENESDTRTRKKHFDIYFLLCKSPNLNVSKIDSFFRIVYEIIFVFYSRGTNNKYLNLFQL